MYGENWAGNGPKLINPKGILLSCNWRLSHNEIDIMAQKGEVLDFVEVKTLAWNIYSFPKEKVA
jgi:Holliday junction resolvase-like predicted endonuclease